MVHYIRNTLLVLFLGTACVPSCAQIQVGATIIASEDNFAYGQNVQLSENGKRLVVSGYGISDQGVALFDNINGDWVEQSFMVPSDFTDSHTIYSVAMSPDGTKIAVGSVENNIIENTGIVKVFHFENNMWSQKGDAIYSEFEGELFGRSIGISNDGNRVIIGARLNSESADFGGRVTVYQYSNAAWSILGPSINGYKNGLKIGGNVAISGDGNYTFMGSNSNYSSYSLSEINIGFVNTRRWANNNWESTDTRNGKKYDHFGYSVAISNDGKIFASGTTQFGYREGYVSVYRNTNGLLENINTIVGGAQEYLGNAIALSADGNKIAVSAILSGTSLYRGGVTIYEYNGNAYFPIGDIIDPNDNPKFGTSVAMSSDGSTVAVGTLDYEYDIPGTETGFVRIYDISGLESPDPYEPPPSNVEFKDITIYPSPAINELHCINCDGVSEWHVVDVTGKKVLSLQGKISNSIDVSMLQTGIYYVYYIKGDEDFKVKKFSKK